MFIVLLATEGLVAAHPEGEAAHSKKGVVTATDLI
jgi:hypothetical protein